MSTHDPFDGIYDDAEASNVATSPAEQQQVVSDTAHAGEPQQHTRTDLSRMRKSELQALARERGLGNVGDRDDLIDRIFLAQR
jgi:hypothetical protein